MTGTSINAAITALVTVFTAAATPLTIEVFDSGPPLDPNLNWLCIGYDESDQSAVSVNRAISDAGMSRDQESYDISNTLSFWRGDQHQSPVSVRAAALAALTALVAALRVDPTLGGAVARASFTEYELDQTMSALGFTASIRFTVHVEAFT